MALRPRYTLAVIVLAGCPSGDPSVPMCERKLDLVDMQAWTIATIEDDPFVPEGAVGEGTVDGRPVCSEAESFYEVFVDEPSWTILTRACGWGTIQQPALGSVRAGEPITLRIWFFEHMAVFDATSAHLAVTVGDRELWSRDFPLPQPESGLVLERIAAPWDIAAGEVVRWHVDNHGANSWNLLELSMFESVPCDALDAGI